MKSLLSPSKLFILFLLSQAIAAPAQDKSRETFEKSFAATDLKTVMLTAYDSDVKINTWDSPSVKIHGELIITDGKGRTDDLEVLRDAFRQSDFQKNGTTLEVNARLAKSSTMVAGIYKTVTLFNGKTIKNVSFKTTYELWMPATLALELQSKYNKIDVGNLAAPVRLDLYNVRLTLGTFGDGSSFKMKYSKATLGKGGNSRFDVYDSDLVGESLGNIDVVSKYSSFRFSTLGEAEFDSYDDDFEFASATGLKVVAKYSNIKVDGNLGFTNLKLYDTDVAARQTGTLQLDAKYSKIEAAEAGALVVSNTYDSRVAIGKLKSVNCLGSKYDKYNLGEVVESAVFADVYSSEIDVEHTSSLFTNFKGKFKYGKVTLGLPSSLQYRMNYETTYGQVNFDSERFGHNRIHDKRSDKSTFSGSTAPDPACTVNFTAYDTRISIGR